MSKGSLYVSHLDVRTSAARDALMGFTGTTSRTFDIWTMFTGTTSRIIDIWTVCTFFHIYVHTATAVDAALTASLLVDLIGTTSRATDNIDKVFNINDSNRDCVGYILSSKSSTWLYFRGLLWINWICQVMLLLLLLLLLGKTLFEYCCNHNNHSIIDCVKYNEVMMVSEYCIVRWSYCCQY